MPEPLLNPSFRPLCKATTASFIRVFPKREGWDGKWIVFELEMRIIASGEVQGVRAVLRLKDVIQRIEIYYWDDGQPCAVYLTVCTELCPRVLQNSKWLGHLHLRSDKNSLLHIGGQRQRVWSIWASFSVVGFHPLSHVWEGHSWLSHSIFDHYLIPASYWIIYW